MKVIDPNKISLAKKQKDIRIFCDLDGVCDHWNEAACDICNIDIDDIEIRNKLKSGKQLSDLGILTDIQIWDKIKKEGPNFWENIKIHPWAKDLVAELEKLGDFAFLSSPSKYADVAADACCGKVKWLDKHFPKMKYIFTHYKEMCASPNIILIDDSDKKCKLFEEASGETFLFPNDIKLLDGDLDINDTIKDIVKKN